MDHGLTPFIRKQGMLGHDDEDDADADHATRSCGHGGDGDNVDTVCEGHADEITSR